MGRRNEDGKRVTKKGKQQTSYQDYGKYNGKYVRRVEEQQAQLTLPKSQSPDETDNDKEKDSSAKKSCKKNGKKK